MIFLLAGNTIASFAKLWRGLHIYPILLRWRKAWLQHSIAIASSRRVRPTYIPQHRVTALHHDNISCCPLWPLGCPASPTVPCESETIKIDFNNTQQLHRKMRWDEINDQSTIFLCDFMWCNMTSHKNLKFPTVLLAWNRRGVILCVWPSDGFFSWPIRSIQKIKNTTSTNRTGWPLIFAMILLDKKLKTTSANFHFVEDVYEVRRFRTSR